MWGNEKLGRSGANFAICKGAVNGEAVGKATCRQTREPNELLPSCKLNLRPDHHGRRPGAGEETYFPQND